jgi:hypothetical protein
MNPDRVAKRPGSAHVPPATPFKSLIECGRDARDPRFSEAINPDEPAKSLSKVVFRE